MAKRTKRTLKVDHRLRDKPSGPHVTFIAGVEYDLTAFQLRALKAAQVLVDPVDGADLDDDSDKVDAGDNGGGAGDGSNANTD